MSVPLAAESAVPAAPVPSWWHGVRRAWVGWRNRRLSDPAFQAAAARFALTRPVANARARQMFDLCAGFVHTQVLLACVRLDLLGQLAAGPRSCAELAQCAAMPVEAMQRLLWAASSLQVCEQLPDGDYALGVHGAALVALPGVQAMIEHHALLYADLADPVARLQSSGGGQLAEFWRYARDGSTASVAGYSALMSASQDLVLADVLAAYRFDRHRCVLDVGGGDGTFLRGVAPRAPATTLWLFDLPAVAALATQRFADAGLSDRTRVTAGDLHRDELPSGADLITLVRVLHDHDDEPALALLRKARRALATGGSLLIAEPMSRAEGADRIADAYFGIYLWAMGQGRVRSMASVAAMARGAGFRRVRRLVVARQALLRVLVVD